MTQETSTALNPTLAITYIELVELAYNDYFTNYKHKAPPSTDYPPNTYPPQDPSPAPTQYENYQQQSVISDDKGVPYGLVFQLGTETVIAIRGTEGIEEWLEDSHLVQVACPIEGGQGQVAKGFSEVYQTLSSAFDAALQSVPAGNSLVIAGHSLGASLAVLLALQASLNVGIAPTLYTYGCPRTGDPTFANAFDSQVPSSNRIANQYDPIPNHPKAVHKGILKDYYYQHVSTLYCIDGPSGLLLTPHHANSYITGLLKYPGAKGTSCATD